MHEKGSDSFTLSRSVRRWSMTLLFLMSLLNYCDRYVLAILLPAIKTDLHLTDTQLGFVTGVVFAIFFTVTGIPIGHFADRHSRRKIIAAAVALWSAMTIACGLAQSFVQLAISRLFLGIGEAGATPPAHSLISDMFSERERALALSVFSMGMPAGILLGFLGGGYAAQAAGWRVALFIFGVPGLVLAAIIFFLLPEQRRGTSDAVRQAAIAPLPLRQVVVMLLRRRSFIHVCLGSGCFTIVWLGFITWLPSYFTRGFNLSVREAGTGLAFVLGFSQFLGLAAGGFLADRLGRHDPRWPFWICALGAALPLPFFAAALLWPSPVIAMLLLFPAFFLAMLQGGPAIAIVQSVAGPSTRAVTVAIYLVVVNLISGFGTQLIGLLSDRLHPAFGASALGASMLAVAALFSIWSALHFLRGARFLADDTAIARGGAPMDT